MLFFIVGGDYDSDGAANGAVDGRGIVRATEGGAVVVSACTPLASSSVVLLYDRFCTTSMADQ